jgi:phosphoesterase RecJ-like protein
LQSEIETLRKVIDKFGNFVLTTHINPDGDGLGSETALALYLKSKGKNAVILNCSSTPRNYLFLNDIFPILHYNPAEHSPIINNAEAIIILDTNHPDRLLALGPEVKDSGAFKICIDHHLDPAEFADLYILDDESSSTGEILYNLLVSLGLKKFDQGTAVSLYTAIMTDTGSFRYPRTDKDLHIIAGNLIEAGADPVKIYEAVYEQGSANRMHLLGSMLSNLKLVYGGKVSYAIITEDIFKSTGTTEDDIDAFAPYLLSIDGVQIGLLFSETGGLIKISFRSKGEIPINKLAKEFGGNGHKNAAGARVTGSSLEEIVPKILKNAEKYI